jgi:hypothetical protein
VPDRVYKDLYKRKPCSYDGGLAFQNTTAHLL